MSLFHGEINQNVVYILYFFYKDSTGTVPVFSCDSQHAL